jgi:NTE family protein
MKKLGLALGVGASRGFAHLGVLKALAEHGIRPDFIAGGSMGSLIGGVFALNGDIGEVESLVEGYEKSDLFVVDLPTAIAKSGVGKDKKFLKTVYRATNGKSIGDCVIPFRAAAVDLITGEEYVFENGPLLTAIRASCSIPGVLPPVRHDGKVLVDIGLLNRVPANVVRAMGAEAVLGVDALGDFRPGWKPKSFLSVISRSFEVVDKHTFHRRREECDFLLTPSHDEVEPMKFTKKYKAVSIEAGYRAAVENMDAIKAML